MRTFNYSKINEQKWDYLYCKDAAKALYLIALNGKHDGVYCLGSGKAEELKQYVETIKNIINSLLEKNIIVETTGYSRNQIFAFEKYINLFLKIGVPKEYFGEGQTFYNLKRQNLPIVGWDDATGKEKTFPANKSIYVVPIPDSEYENRL